MEVLASTAALGRIAVVRALQLGDMLCTVPALRSLRAALPQAHITLIGLPWARDFVSRYAMYLDDFLEFPGFPGIPERPLEPRAIVGFLAEAQQRQFDLAIQLHGSGPHINPFTQLLGAKRTAGFYLPGDSCPEVESFLPWPEAGHEIQRLTSLIHFLGGPDCGDELEFPLSRSDYHEAHGLLKRHQLHAGKYVCLHPGGRMLSRRWNLDKFARVAEWLDQKGYRVVITGASFEAELAVQLEQRIGCEVVNAAGQTGLGGMAALLTGARLLVSNDTGASHIATAVRTPSVVVVLGSQPDRWAPLNAQRHRTVMKPVECRPCAYHECPIGFHCERQVQPADVIDTIQHILEREYGDPFSPEPMPDLNPPLALAGSESSAASLRHSS
jgi:ADP-heptose:LPS heptosyltransferase